MDIAQLREKRGALLRNAEAILEKITAESRSQMTTEEEQRFDALHAEAKRIADLIDRAEDHAAEVEDGERSLGRKTDPTQPGSEDGTARDHDAEQRVDLGPDQSVRVWLERRGLLKSPRAYGALTFGAAMRALVTGPRTELERRALGEGTDSAGGFTVPDILLAQLIDRMRARTVTIRAGARTVPLTSDTTKIARLATDPIAGWRSENAVVPESDPTFESVTFTARALAVLVKASRELLEDSVNVEQALLNAFARSMAVELDRVALKGTGTAPEPRGIANTSGVGSFSMGVNGASLANFDPLLSSLQLVADANAADATAAIMAPRTLTAFEKLKDTTNQPMRRPASLEAMPFLQTTSLPVNETQGTAVNASRVITGDFSELLIGVRTSMRVEILREAFAANLQYGFVAWLRADMALAHAASFSQVVGIIP